MNPFPFYHVSWILSHFVMSSESFPILSCRAKRSEVETSPVACFSFSGFYRGGKLPLATTIIKCFYHYFLLYFHPALQGTAMKKPYEKLLRRYCLASPTLSWACRRIGSSLFEDFSSVDERSEVFPSPCHTSNGLAFLHLSPWVNSGYSSCLSMPEFVSKGLPPNGLAWHPPVFCNL